MDWDCKDPGTLNMLILRTTITFCCCILMLNCFAQKKYFRSQGGVWPYKEKIGLRATEVTVREYLEFIANNDYDPSLFPDETMLQSLPSAFLFEALRQRNNNYVTIAASGYGVTWIHIKKQSNAQATKKLESVMLMPVTGISYQQATRFCQWKERLSNEVYLKKSAYKLSISLPSENDYKELLQNFDSTLDIKTQASKFYFKGAQIEKNAEIQQERELNKLLRADRFGKDRNNFYGLQGNAAEMTATEGVSMGGSYIHFAAQSLSTSNISYTKPEIWLGFRFIVRVITDN
ncbi:MAG: SUMF1/EgtB/PvdO family nonheme iron enzyme [Chitinophagaceae bacterium]